MADDSVNRYTMLGSGFENTTIPFGEIPVSDSDFYEEYRKGITRLDRVSFKYYGNANYGWLILQANPQFGSIEFKIPDKSLLRIPSPLKNALNSYQESIKKYINNNK